MAPPPGTPPGPSPDAISAQAEALARMNATLEKIAAGFDKLSGAGRGVATSLTQTEQAAAAAEAALQGANTEAEKFAESLRNQIAQVESFSGAASVLKGALQQMAKSGSSGAKGILALGSALKGAGSGFKFSLNLAKSFLGGIQDMIGGIFDLTAAILSVPFKLWEGLIGMAKGGGGGGGGLLEALEKVREVFGDIKQGAGEEVISIARGLASWGDMAPGLFKVSRQFGTLKDAIEYVMKLAGPAPVLFSSLKDEFEKTGKNVFIMAKGLGIGEEEFAGLMNAAKSFGQTVESIQVEMTKFAKGLSAEFGLNSKLMSRDMARAMKDVKHFANSSVKEIAKATAYAHSLGLELKDITGILDAFNTFDQAAENVSKLSQAFGINIDVMKLVEAKTPDEALKMLKDSLNSAGKSVENMNRQELQLLAATTGMSEEAIRQGSSSKNQAISMNRLASTTENLSKKTMTASEATKALKNDIERVVGGGGGGGPESDSLLGMFFEGFMQGISTTKVFMQVLKNLRMDFTIIQEKGRELGRAFVEYFPGVKKFFEGLADMLSPAKIGGLFGSFKDTFIKTFQDLKNNGEFSAKGLVNALKTNFIDYLTKSGEGGSKLLEGLREMWEAAKLIIASAIEYVGELMADGFNMIADALEGKFNDTLGGIGSTIRKETGPIVSAFQKAANLVMPAFKRVFDLAMDALGTAVKKFFSENWGKIILFFGGPAFVSAIAQMAQQALVQGVLKKLLAKQITEGVAEGAAAAGGPATGIFSQIGSKLAPLLTNPIGIAMVAVAGTAYAVWSKYHDQIMSETEKFEADKALADVKQTYEKAKKAGDPAEISKAREELKKTLDELENARKTQRGTSFDQWMFGVEHDERLKYANRNINEVQKMYDDLADASEKGNYREANEQEYRRKMEKADAVARELNYKDSADLMEKILAKDTNFTDHFGEASKKLKEAMDLRNSALDYREGGLKDLQAQNAEAQKQLDSMDKFYEDLARIKTRTFVKKLGGEGEAQKIIDSYLEESEKLANVRESAQKNRDAMNMYLSQGNHSLAKKFEAKMREDIETGKAIKNNIDATYGSTLDYITEIRGGRLGAAFARISKGAGMSAVLDIAKDATHEEAETAAKLQAEGQEMIKKSMDEIGATNLDNVEERIKKVKDISAKVLGKEADFNAEVKKVRESLAKFEFVVMDDATQAKFAQGLAGLTHIEKFIAAVKSTVASMTDIRQTLGAGTSIKGTATIIETAITEIKTSFENIKIPDMAAAVAKVDSLTQPIKTIVEKVGAAFGGAGVKETKVALDAMVADAEAIPTNAQKISTALSKISSQAFLTPVDASITSTATSIKKQVEKMASAINEFNAALVGASRGTENIDVKLGSVANGLGIKDASYSVARGPVNFEFKINIHVDGKSLEGTMVSSDQSVIVRAFHAVQNGTKKIQGVAGGLNNVAPVAESPSDIRLKEQIEWVDKSPLGINIYEFKYIGQEGRYRGVMAQELLGTPYENAVTFNGQYYSVRYDKIDVNFTKLV